MDFLKGENLSSDLRKLMKNIPCDVVVQHSQMAALHTESVNTLRIVSFLTDHFVKVYTVILRIGVGKKRMDNSSYGGVICGVYRDGNLERNGVLLSGKVLVRHPDQRYLFREKKISCLDKALNLVKEAHIPGGY